MRSHPKKYWTKETILIEVKRYCEENGFQYSSKYERESCERLRERFLSSDGRGGWWEARELIYASAVSYFLLDKYKIASCFEKIRTADEEARYQRALRSKGGGSWRPMPVGKVSHDKPQRRGDDKNVGKGRSTSGRFDDGKAVAKAKAGSLSASQVGKRGTQLAKQAEIPRSRGANSEAHSITDDEMYRLLAERFGADHVHRKQ